jgi:serine/threonine-protein kinase
MGQVYLAHDTRLADKPCAVKELTPDPHASPEEQAQAADQFHREAAILAHLNHPNLPNVYDYFEEGGCFHLVMDYVEGLQITSLTVKYDTLTINLEPRR